MSQRLTIENIDAITADPRFRALPNQMVPSTTAWHDLTRKMAEFGVDTYAWELAQYIAQVFDAYGDEIKEVTISWSTTTEGNEVFLQHRATVNGCDVSLSYGAGPLGSVETRVEIDGLDDLTEHATSSDAGLALGRMHGVAEDAPQPLALHLDDLCERFENITSAEQARQVASSINPDILGKINALVSEIGLANTDHPAPSKPRPSPRV